MRNIRLSGMIYKPSKGKTALISGAGRNNGRTISLAFAREGADLILVSKQSADDLNQVAKDCEALGVQALPMLADMGRHEEVNRVVQQGLQRFGKVDVVVSLAGVRLAKLPWDFSYDEWQDVFAINLHSTFYLAKALAPGMIERGQGGSFIAVTGNSALTGDSPKAAAMSASRHGLHGLIKGLAQALGPHGIRANLLVLANVESERRTPEWYANAAKRAEKAPMRRMGRQSEVASAAVFLACDESSYITGDRIACEGGIQL